MDSYIFDEVELLPIPKKERKKPRVQIVVKKVFVVEFHDIYGRKKHKNKLSQHAADVLVFKRQFINKYAPYDKDSFFGRHETEYGESGYLYYGKNERDYKELKRRWLKLIKFLRNKRTN